MTLVEVEGNGRSKAVQNNHQTFAKGRKEQDALPHASMTGVRLPYSTTGLSVVGKRSEMMFLMVPLCERRPHWSC